MKKTILILSLIAALPLAALAEKSAFLGVATSELSPAMKAQLDVQHGVVIADVIDGSPASRALKKHDILTKLGDQKLMNPAQFVELVKMCEKGESVTVEFVRAGKAGSVDIELGERDVADESSGQTSNMDLSAPSIMALPGTVQSRVFVNGKEMEIGDAGEMMIDLKNALDQAQNRQQMKDLKKELGKVNIDLEKILKDAGVNIKIDGMDLNVGENGGNSVSVSSGSSSSSVATSVWNENGVSYQTTTSDGAKVVKITKDGAVIFEGPCNTDEDMKKIPKEHRKKLEEIQGKVKVFVNGDNKKKEEDDEKEKADR